MKLLIKCLIIMFSCGVCFPQNCESKILVISDNSDFKVIVNDTLDIISQNEIYLKQGYYNITVTRLSSLWNKKSYNESFFLDSCETKKINFSSSEQILIDSDPQDVKVYSGDSLLGFTPLRLSINHEKLMLRKEGFADKEVELDGRISALNASLEFIGENKKENFFNSTTSKILFGSMIVLGATSAYFKIKADRNYEDYLSTGDMKFKDQTEKYDLISGITLGLTQINFGYLIYKIFFDN